MQITPPPQLMACIMFQVLICFSSGAGYQQAGGKPGGYPPPQPQGYPQPYAPPPGTTATTIITPPGPIIVNMAFGESPISMVCPHCQTHIITCTTYQDGTLTWLAAGALCLLG